MSFKIEDAIPYKGLLAYHFLSVFEVDPRIDCIRPATRPITWYDGSRWQSYMPRYTLRVRGRSVNHWRYLDVEVVTSLEEQRDQFFYNRVRAGAARQKRHFKVFTEKTVNIEPRLTNSKLMISQAGRGVVTDAEIRAVQSFAHSSSTFTLNEMVSAGVLAYEAGYAAILNLAASGKLCIEQTRQFDGESKIWRRSS